MTAIWTIKRGQLLTVSFGLLSAWACTVADKGDYTFTDNPNGSAGKGGSSSAGKGTGGAAGEATGTGGAKAGNGGRGGGGRSSVGGRSSTAGESGAAGEAGVSATGGSSGSGGNAGAAGESGAGQGGMPSTGTCGDGTVDPGEQCDDGDSNTDACAYGVKSCTVCSTSCRTTAGKTAYCGDGKRLSSREECDDGNAVDETCTYGDQSCAGCSTSCKSAAKYCGDDKLDAPVVTQLKIEYLGLWGDCGPNLMPFYLNDVLLPNLPQVACSCGPDVSTTVVVTDAAVLAAVRPNHNVFYVRGVADVWTYFSWARLTFSFDTAPDQVVTVDPLSNVGGTDLCAHVVYGDYQSDPFSIGVEQCDGGSSCSACESALPFKSCQEILNANATAPSGVYLVDKTGGTADDALSVYCDMTTGTTYESLGFGQHDASYSGYANLSSDDWVDPQIQQAFIALYNLQDGLVNLTSGFTDGDCCIEDAAGHDLSLNGEALMPAGPTDTGQASGCGSGYTTSRLRIYVNGGNDLVPSYDSTTGQSLTTTFFSSNTPSSGTICATDRNPGLFIKSYE